MAMVGLRLVHLIENHSDELVEDLLQAVAHSARTRDLRKVPPEELRGRLHELLRHLSEWLLTKTDRDIEKRYVELGVRRAHQGVALADFCWALVMIKENIWHFLNAQAFAHNPVELYGEMEFLRLLDQFFDRALYHVARGYEQALLWSPQASAAHAAD
jgi:hypothetical protein